MDIILHIMTVSMMLIGGLAWHNVGRMNDLKERHARQPRMISCVVKNEGQRMWIIETYADGTSKEVILKEGNDSL